MTIYLKRERDLVEGEMNLTDDELRFLKEKAKWVRETIMHMICRAKSGHPGGSLSIVEILVSLYYRIMNINPNDPKWADRDRFVLSKGHCCPPLYAILADLGYYDMSNLEQLRRYGSILHGHPSIVTPGIDAPSGSLGNGLSIATGMAMAGRRREKDYKIFVLIGDGEMQEGANWEAAMSIAHHNLNNVIAIIDCNKLQINGEVSSIIKIEPLKDKWEAFGWDAIEIDGHDFNDILNALEQARSSDKPTVIIADTIKGKGVSFMENEAVWHGKCITEEDCCKAINDIRVGKW